MSVTVVPSTKLTDWLRSDWLETSHYQHFWNNAQAYRLASIGLVGNGGILGIAEIGTPLTDWLRSDWLETPPYKRWSHGNCDAYRLASIGLVGNGISVLVARMDDRNAYRLASIGLVGNLASICDSFVINVAYRLASIGLVGN